MSILTRILSLILGKLYLNLLLGIFCATSEPILSCPKSSSRLQKLIEFFSKNNYNLIFKVSGLALPKCDSSYSKCEIF